MKRYNIFVGIIAVAISITSCKVKPDKIDKILLNLDSTNVAVDTCVNKFDADAKYFEQAREFSFVKDSLDVLKFQIDSITKSHYKIDSTTKSIKTKLITTQEKLGIAEYKLLRIREYNRIAAKGNNIKFLRGWIIRTLK